MYLKMSAGTTESCLDMVPGAATGAEGTVQPS